VLKLVRVSKIEPKYRKNTIVVKMACYSIAKDGSPLSTWALGSCLAIILFDPSRKIAALAHAMLPDPIAKIDNPAKYVSTAIDAMIHGLKNFGAKKDRLRAGLVGGARILKLWNDSSSPLTRIGTRNVQRARKILMDLGVPIEVEDVGGTRGRNLVFFPTTGIAMVSYAGSSWLEVAKS